MTVTAKSKKTALRWRRTKIVATLGPATSSVEAITALLKLGVDVVRLNMSHGDHAGHQVAVSRVRNAAKKLGRHVAILADLCGPKIRVGRFEGGGIKLQQGKNIVVDTAKTVGYDGLVPSLYRDLHQDVHVALRLYARHRR